MDPAAATSRRSATGPCLPGSADSLTSQAAEITARGDRHAAQLAHDAATTACGEVGALQAGAKALFGDEFVVVPEFGLARAQGDEWAVAVTASAGGALLSYLTGTAGIERPVEEWMSGVARVRPMIKEWR